MTQTHVDFWPVNIPKKSTLPMSVSQVSGHLMSDWIRSLPASVGSSFIGWPPYLLEDAMIDKVNALVLHPSAGRSDRQWKGVLSWMLGIAGARHVLEVEKYRW